MQLNINTIRQMAMALVGAVAVAACGGKDNGTETPAGSGENVSVSISPDRETMYRNPFSGWVIYSGLGDGLSDNFWQEYDNMNSAIGKVKVSDYANALLIRSYWSQAEPEEGVYFWDESCNTKPAQRFRMLREGARERGLKLIFQLRADSRDLHQFIRNIRKGQLGRIGPDDPTSPVRVLVELDILNAFERLRSYYLNIAQTLAGGKKTAAR